MLLPVPYATSRRMSSIDCFVLTGYDYYASCALR